MNKNKLLSGRGKNLTGGGGGGGVGGGGGGKWVEMGREVGREGEGSGEWVPPCPSPRFSIELKHQLPLEV